MLRMFPQLAVVIEIELKFCTADISVVNCVYFCWIKFVNCKPFCYLRFIVVVDLVCLLWIAVVHCGYCLCELCLFTLARRC